MSSEGNNAAGLSGISSEMPEISREELRPRLSDPALKIVDVLPESSYVEWHIPGALSLPLELVASRARERTRLLERSNVPRRYRRLDGLGRTNGECV